MHIAKITALAAGLLLAHVQTASALSLSYEETGSSTKTTGATATYTQLPVSDFFGNNPPKVSGTVGAPADAGFTFYDEYVFSVANSTVDAASFLLNETNNVLAISNLQMRLYEVNPSSPVPDLSHSPAGLIEDWSTPISSNGVTTNLGTAMLDGGTYILEVRGDVTGSAGGSYAGLIDLQPVPVPAALPLLLSGLGLLGGFTRKRV